MQRGPAFLAYRNFNTILRYNNSTSYGMSIGLLADRIAGRPGEQVTLRWETWTAADGWKPGPTVNAPVSGSVIDPDAAATAPATAVTLPFDDHAGQAALRAERSWTRPQGGQVTLRSNALLITLHEAAP